MKSTGRKNTLQEISNTCVQSKCTKHSLQGNMNIFIWSTATKRTIQETSNIWKKSKDMKHKSQGIWDKCV